MIIDNEILAEFYEIVNVDSVNNEINGNIYQGEKPLNSKLQDITLQLLTNVATNNDKLQTGVLNINCYCEGTSVKTRKTADLTRISKAVINSLGFVNGEGGSGLLNYRIDEVKTFRDKDEPEMFYVNIRLDFSYKNN